LSGPQATDYELLDVLSAFLIAGLLGASDGGIVDEAIKQIGEALLQQMGADQASRARRVEEWKRIAATGAPAEKAIAQRALRIEQGDAPPEAQFREWIAVLRDVAPLARGRFADEKAVANAFAVISQTAVNLGQDAAPLRREAVARARELVLHYPKESRAHAALAFALMLEDDATGGPSSDAVLAELKRCAEGDPGGWCRKKYQRIAAAREQPRCAGTALRRPLTLTAASSFQPGGARAETVQAWDGTKLALESKPSFVSKDFLSIELGEEGGLQMSIADPHRLEAETRRIQALPGGSMVLKFGDDVLLVARVVEAIPNGRIQWRAGAGKPSPTLDELCVEVEHPKLAPELRLQ
jgi:hypothetical protein